MINKVLVCLFIFHLISTNPVTPPIQQIEIFDISQDKVIESIQANMAVQQEVKKILDGITGVYAKYNPIPNKGFMIRVPLEPNIMVRSQWFDDLVDEVTIIFPTEEQPYLMIFDDENNSYFLTFEADTTKFLALLDFNP
ncbi:hypothetical protein V7147_17760 [Bacillus sp. JJ1521]|uniref:hypothetical protein n=1 Tax=Bacillus sp. JJ1521 TaxID=3122957 RepID=UPI002FFDA928